MGNTSLTVCLEDYSLAEGAACNPSYNSCNGTLACYNGICQNRIAQPCNYDSDCSTNGYITCQCPVLSTGSAGGYCKESLFQKSYLFSELAVTATCSSLITKAYNDGCFAQLDLFNLVLPCAPCQKTLAQVFCCFGCQDDYFEFSPYAEALKGFVFGCNFQDTPTPYTFMNFTQFSRISTPCCQSISSDYCPGEINLY